MVKIAEEQAQTLRDLADQIEEEDTPLPADVYEPLAKLVTDVAFDYVQSAEYRAELDRRAQGVVWLSGEEVLRDAYAELGLRAS